MYDIFGMLAVGGTIVIPEPQQACWPAAWVDLINRHQITVWNSVPALMEMLTTYCSLHAEVTLGSLRHVLLSGDWIPVSLPKKVRTCVRRRPSSVLAAYPGRDLVGLLSDRRRRSQLQQHPIRQAAHEPNCLHSRRAVRPLPSGNRGRNLHRR